MKTDYVLSQRSGMGERRVLVLSGFGELLKKRRKQLNITQEQLSEKMGFAETGNISNYERKKSLPSIEHLPILAEALDVSVGYFFGEASEKCGNEEKELLIAFRSLDKEMQLRAVNILKCLSG